MRVIGKLAPYRKCIAAGVLAFFTWSAKCAPEGFSAEELWQIAGAVATATIGVYVTAPNAAKQ